MRQVCMRVASLLLVLIAIVACKKEDVAKSNQSELNSFSVQELAITFQEDAEGNWYSKAQADDDITELTAEFEISALAMVFIGNTPQTSGYNKNDFSNPVTYTVRAEDGSKSHYTVSIFKEASVASFSIAELNDVEFIISSNDITATVINGTDLTSLTAVFETTEGAKLFVDGLEQVSGSTKNNFTIPLVYTLKETDGTEKNYTVTIIEGENQAPIADAGDDKTIIVNQGETTANVQLNGSGSSDLEGPIETYEWKIGTTTIATGMKAEVSLNLGNHDIELIVTDNKGATGSDRVNIVVQEAGVFTPIDADATQATKNLLTNIGKMAISDKFAFGQEFPMSFKLNGLRNDLSTSDCNEVTGDHPGVFGIDPHYMLYKTSEQRQLHIDEAKAAYANGAVVTFDFHQQSKNDHKIYIKDITSAEDKSLMYDIVNDLNNAHAWYFDEMDEILSIINNDLAFPVVFRLFHEMDGNWFWWGSSATNHSSQLYIDFYQLTVEYIKDRSNLVLFAWSPNGEVRSEYYPGDAYVDVVGFDIYEPNVADLKSKLIDLSEFAVAHNKVAILAETGYRNDFISNAPGFWSDVILEAIKQGGSEVRIAWVLSWFNAPWHSNQSDLFIPDTDSPQNAKDKFKLFKDDDTTLFMEDVKAFDVYN